MDPSRGFNWLFVLKVQGHFADPVEQTSIRSSWQHAANIWCVKNCLKNYVIQTRLDLNYALRVVRESEPGCVQGPLAAKSRGWQKTAEFPAAPASLSSRGSLHHPRCPLRWTTSEFIHFQEMACGLL